MKKRMAGIIIFAISISWALCQTRESSTKGNHRTWNLVITPQTQKHSLDSVATAWRKDSIVLKFSKLEYSAEGRLMKIKGSVAIMGNEKKPSGTFSSDSLKTFNIHLDDSWSVCLSGK
jgi:hypothetical protein